ncbi:MAG: shikimate kinase [Bacteroidetes bacterium]|nr:shikimate kinase [Bacteroidota bacterium]
MRVYLIGYMGSGKSAHGKTLAKRLGFDFYDLDKLFETKYQLSINDFFEKYGENLFRKIETEILESTLELDNCVISTGGGTACFNENLKFINSYGISVYLELRPKSLYIRLKNSKKKRPLLMGCHNDELLNKIENQLKEREAFYKQAHYIVKGENLDVNEVVELLNNAIMM